jgi:hypothetical protein
MKALLFALLCCSCASVSPRVCIGTPHMLTCEKTDKDASFLCPSNTIPNLHDGVWVCDRIGSDELELANAKVDELRAELARCKQ